MANATIVIDFTNWPEVIHGIRQEVAKAIAIEAMTASPETAAALRRVGAKLEAGLTDVAQISPGDIREP